MTTRPDEMDDEQELDEIPPQQHLLAGDTETNGHLPEPVTSKPTQSTSSKSIPHLDGLRGMAAFWVYMSHWIAYWCADETRADITKGFGFKGGNYAFTTLPFVRTFFTGGIPAVAVFFVLSGYVLSRGPLRQIQQGTEKREVLRGLVAAGIRRPIRLFWPVIAMTFLFAMLLHAPFGLAPKVHWPVPEPTALAEAWKWVKETTVALNPFVDSGPFGRWYPYDPPVWTIAVEFKGSVVVFAFMAALCYVTERFRVGVIVLTCLAFLAVYEWAMSMFIAGLWLAYNDLHFLDGVIAEKMSKRAQSVFYHVLFFTGWYLLSQPVGMGEPEDALETPGYNYITLLTPLGYAHGTHKYWRFWELPGATLCVYGVLRINWLQAFLSSRPLRYLGRVSFSLYLVHILVLATAGDRIARFFGKIVSANHEDPMWFDNRFPVPSTGPVGLPFNLIFTQLLFILPLNLLLAEIGTSLLDEPSVKMGRWLVDRIPQLRRGRAGQ